MEKDWTKKRMRRAFARWLKKEYNIVPTMATCFTQEAFAAGFKRGLKLRRAGGKRRLGSF